MIVEGGCTLPQHYFDGLMRNKCVILMTSWLENIWNDNTLYWSWKELGELWFQTIGWVFASRDNLLPLLLINIVAKKPGSFISIYVEMCYEIL